MPKTAKDPRDKIRDEIGKDRLLDRWAVVIARYNARAVRSAVARDGVGDECPPTPERDDDLCEGCVSPGA